jgi:biotin-dependent carboxylase-like uncharacterized protein
MSGGLSILSAGPGVTIQDGGRRSYLRFGVTSAGPMDRLAHATANLALAAPAGAAAIEVSLGGADLAADGGSLWLAVAGGAFKLLLDGRTLPPAVVVHLDPGSRLAIRPGAAGSWCYVAVAGHIDLPPVLGSLSTHTRSGLGGLAGRALQAGDRLPIADPRTVDQGPGEIVAPWLDRPGEVVRVILGPQDDYFAADQIAAFLGGPWTVSRRSDRMAYQLEGTPLSHAKGFNIVSDAIAHGAVQVLGDGKPIVLMADRQPTGGYPKIATVIGPDLGRLAQLRPGSTLRFAAVSVDQAVAARRAEAAVLARPPALEPLVRTQFPPDFLLARNLVDGVLSARRWAGEG